MKRSEYEFLKEKVRRIQAAKTNLLVEMELKKQTLDDEAFRRWWEDEGNMEKNRSYAEDIERISMELDRAEVEEDDAPLKMFPGGKRS